MSRQLLLSFGGKALIAPYFKNPVTNYEKFVNKKWQENHLKYPSKAKFREFAMKEWAEIKHSEDALNRFMRNKKPQTEKVVNYFTRPNKGSKKKDQDLDISIIPFTTIKAPNFDVNREKYLNEKELFLVEKFFNAIGFKKGEEFLCAEIKSDKVFIKLLFGFSYEWKCYFDLYNDFKVGIVRSRKSYVSSKVDLIEKETVTLKTLLDNFCQFETKSNMPLNVLTETLVEKSKVLKSIITTITILQRLINEKDLLKAMRKRIKERADRLSLPHTRDLNEFAQFECFNDTHLTWGNVFDSITEMQNGNEVCAPLDSYQLLNIADYIESSLSCNINELGIPNEISHLEQILRHMPVILIRTAKKEPVFVNLHEFYYTPGALEYLLFPLECNENLSREKDINTAEANKAPSPDRNYTGKPSLVSKFPDLIDVVANFLKQNGFSAQFRRRTETGNSSGVTIKQIQDHIYTNVPGLKEHGISHSSIRRLFEAPNRSRKSRFRYKGHINARVGIKSNQFREYHPDAHHLFARNKQLREFAELFSDITNIFSIDDMAKVKVGAPAVSRYHQLRRLYMTNDMPNLSDHDFPVPGYLINVSGYMKLENILPSIAEEKSTGEGENESNDLLPDDMYIDKFKNSLKNPFEILSAQLKSINFDANPEELEAFIFDEIESALEEYELEDSLTDVKSKLKISYEHAIHYMPSILKSTSKSFSCNIKVFDMRSESSFTITNEAEPVESVIYIAYDHEGFSSPIFCKQTLEQFNNIPKLEDKRLTYDSLGRIHLSTSYTGRACTFLRAQRFQGTTIATHVDDLIKIIESNETMIDKPLLMLMSDNGPDFNPKSLLNTLYFFRLFKYLKIDMLTVFTFAARYSAYNCVEHLWSPLSDKLSGVVFSPTYPGDKEAPAKMSKLTKDQITEKEKVIFDNAMNSIKNDHWKEAHFDLFEVITNVVPCGEDYLKFDDYEYVKAYLKCPIRDLHTYKDLQTEYLTLLEHIDRRSNCINFVKCSDRSCCEEFSSKDLETYLKNNNMRLPEVKKSTDGHYNTFLENLLDDGKTYGDATQPTVAEKALGVCDICPNFSFSSKTEKARHFSVFHKNRNATKKKQKNFKCTFEACNMSFSSQPTLSRHQIAMEHRKRDQPIAAASKKSTKPKRKRTFLEASRYRFSSGSSSEDEIEKCDAKPCINNKENPKWIQCDQCDKWYHVQCAKLLSLTAKEVEELVFICEKCKEIGQ